MEHHNGAVGKESKTNTKTSTTTYKKRALELRGDSESYMTPTAQRDHHQIHSYMTLTDHSFWNVKDPSSTIVMLSLKNVIEMAPWQPA